MFEEQIVQQRTTRSGFFSPLSARGLHVLRCGAGAGLVLSLAAFGLHAVPGVGILWRRFFVATILILPVVLVYPQILLRRFFFYPCPSIFVGTILCAAVLEQRWVHALRDFVLRFQKIIVRAIIIVLSGLLLLIVLRTDTIVHGIFQLDRVPGIIDAILGSYGIFLYSLPVALLSVLVIVFVWYLCYPKLDFSSLSIVLFFLFLSAASIGSYSGTAKSGARYSLVSAQYLFVFFPLSAVGLASSQFFQKASRTLTTVIVAVAGILLVIAEYVTQPFSFTTTASSSRRGISLPGRPGRRIRLKRFDTSMRTFRVPPSTIRRDISTISCSATSA